MAIEFSAEAGSDVYYASLYYPPHERQRLRVLYTLLQEIINVPASCSDRGVAQVKLAWWRDEIERTTTLKPRHYLTQTALEHFQQQTTLAPLYLALCEQLSGDLLEPKFANAAALLDSLRTRYGDWLDALTATVNCERETTLLDLFVYTQCLNYWCDFRQQQRHGLLLCDTSALERLGLSPDTVRYASNSDEIKPLVQKAIATASDNTTKLISALSAQQRKKDRFIVCLARFALLGARLTAESDFRVLEQRVQPTPLSKLWIAWRTRYFA